MAYEIYMVECPLGRRYVGCSRKGAHHRWSQHTAWFRDWPENDADAGIGDAIRRFGKDAFTLTILATTEHVEIARALETALIEHCGALTPKGYNRAAKSNIPLRPYDGPHWTEARRSRSKAA